MPCLQRLVATLTLGFGNLSKPTVETAELTRGEKKDDLDSCNLHIQNKVVDMSEGRKIIMITQHVFVDVARQRFHRDKNKRNSRINSRNGELSNQVSKRCLESTTLQ